MMQAFRIPFCLCCASFAPTVIAEQVEQNVHASSASMIRVDSRGNNVLARHGHVPKVSLGLLRRAYEHTADPDAEVALEAPGVRKKRIISDFDSDTDIENDVKTSDAQEIKADENELEKEADEIQEANACASCDCSFIGNGGKPGNCDAEIERKAMVEKWIPEDAVVLEVGARFGSISCAISSKLKRSGNQVSLEADYRYWDALEKNRHNHKCNFNQANAMIGTKKGQRMASSDLGYFVPKLGELIMSNGFPLEYLTLNDLQKKYKLKFNVGVFDCRGCASFIFADFPELKNQLNTIILEQHNQDERNLVEDLLSNGWTEVDKKDKHTVLSNRPPSSETIVQRSTNKVQWKMDLYACPTERMGSSCEQVCKNNRLACNEERFRGLFIDKVVKQAFFHAGRPCKSMKEFSVPSMWDGPWQVDGVCGYNSHPAGTAHCRGSAVCGYTRVCPCV